MMNFLGKQAVHKHEGIAWADIIDPSVFQSLTPAHQNMLNKLEHQSASIDKLMTKISSNQIELNTDMLTKILDFICIQNSLPIQALHCEDIASIKEAVDLDLPSQLPSHIEHWLKLLDKLKLWDPHHFQQASIVYILKLSALLLIQDKCPNIQAFNQIDSKLARFWKKNQNDSQMKPILVLFKYIYEKFKFFHWDLLPNTKRPMDLYEIYCLIEDACVEKNLLHLSPLHIEFQRSLNASALLFSAIQAFPAAMPDFIAFELDELEYGGHKLLYQEPELESVLNHADYQCLFGGHASLSNLNKQALITGLASIIKLFLDGNRYKYIFQNEATEPQIIEMLQMRLHDLTQRSALQKQLEYINKRLVFIFNRLTGLGFLLRSPTLKGLGYQPLINTESLDKFRNNLDLLLTNIAQLSSEKQTTLLEDILQKIHQEKYFSLEPSMNYHESEEFRSV